MVQITDPVIEDMYLKSCSYRSEERAKIIGAVLFNKIPCLKCQYFDGKVIYQKLEDIGDYSYHEIMDARPWGK